MGMGRWIVTLNSKYKVSVWEVLSITVTQWSFCIVQAMKPRTGKGVYIQYEKDVRKKGLV
jgi:hypothetical protein